MEEERKVPSILSDATRVAVTSSSLYSLWKVMIAGYEWENEGGVEDTMKVFRLLNKALGVLQFSSSNIGHTR